MQYITSTLQRHAGCIQWIQRGRLTRCGKDRRLRQTQLFRGLSKIQLRSSFDTEGVIPKMYAVEIPLNDLRTSKLIGDLCGKDAFANGTRRGRRFAVKDQVTDQLLGNRRVNLRL